MELSGRLECDHDVEFGSFSPVRSGVSSEAETIDVAALQLTSIDDVDTNLRQILGLLAQLESLPPDLVCLPENSLYLRIREGDSIPALALDHPALLALLGWTNKFGAAIHVGSVPLAREGRLFNSSLLIEATRGVREIYSKIHLFDVDVIGHKPVRESDVFAAGERAATFELAGWNIGASICYDLRFSELYARYAASEVDALLIPSAFLVPTGRAHWDVLVRARAIESQAYVVAAAQGGLHLGHSGGRRETFGHSMIVDPWGEVVQTLPDDFGDRRILRATLSRDRIRRVREQIPMKSHRRLK